MTKKERNEIYKEAYNEIGKRDAYFMCNRLHGKVTSYKEFILAMPELWDGCSALSGSDLYMWFSEDEIHDYSVGAWQPMLSLRLTILALCIAMTE